MAAAGDEAAHTDPSVPPFYPAIRVFAVHNVFYPAGEKQIKRLEPKEVMKMQINIDTIRVNSGRREALPGFIAFACDTPHFVSGWSIS